MGQKQQNKADAFHDTKSEQLKHYEINNKDKVLTTNDGVPIHDNNNSLKAGSRGPSLMEDFIHQDKMAHFDRERIPERVVHARGSGAHGVFKCTTDISKYTKAHFLQQGVETPLFVRFSTVVGFKGSTDLARDVRGFSVKFYTQEGNYDFVGINVPVFFIQDAINFPDLIHAVKPEPDKELPQAASAHDTLWDFVSLMPESAHAVMWLMSDRAIPRSFRMMEGFGVHTFKLINKEEKVHFVKFHWKPKLGAHSVAWNEAQKISGFDTDFHRRDLWDNIDNGNFPEWELGIQVVPEEDEHKYSFDLLDPTKLIPEELVPVQIIGTMTLNRNPENFFAETEQAAFHPGRLVPGIDFSNDPLLQGRIFSYADTQIYRLGGANFHEIPINRSVNGKNNNQKDGTGRQDILKGKVSYFPNSIGGGCPYHAMMKGEVSGFTSNEEKVEGYKVRQRSDSFADHFTQPRLYFNSLSKPEQNHVINGYSFELSKVTLPEVRLRYLGILSQIDEHLCNQVAQNLGLKAPKELDKQTIFFARHNHPNYPLKAKKPEVEKSAALSIRVKEGEGTAATRKIALLINQHSKGVSVKAIQDFLKENGAEGVIIAPHVGEFGLKDGTKFDVIHSFLTEASVCYDGVYIPENVQIDSLSDFPEVVQFVNESYRHCKVIGLEPGTEDLLAASYIKKDTNDIGLVMIKNDSDKKQFLNALKMHRVWERENSRKVPS